MALPPRPTAEHQTALQPVLDLALKYRPSPALAERIAALAATVGTAPDPWGPVYEEAIGIVEALQREMAAQHEALHQRAHAVEDPNDLKRRMVENAKEEVEVAKRRTLAQLKGVVAEGEGRLKRQAAHLLTEHSRVFRAEVTLLEAPASFGVRLSVDPEFWHGFVRQLNTTCDTWTQAFSTQHEPLIVHAVRPIAEVSVTERAPLHCPSALVAPAPPGSAVLPPPAREVQVPAVGDMLVTFVKSNIMTLGIASMVLAALLSMLPSGAGAHPTSPTNLRGLVILAAMPVLGVGGWQAAQRERLKVRTKLMVEHREKAADAILAAAETLLDAHRQALERWLRRRAEECTAAVDRWHVEVARPRVQAVEGQAADVVRRQRAESTQVQKELTALEQGRNLLNQTLLADLRRRLKAVQA